MDEWRFNDAFRREQQYHAVGMQYLVRVHGELAHILNEKYFDAVRGQLAPAVKDVTDKNAAEKSPAVQEAYKLNQSVGAAADAAARRRSTPTPRKWTPV